MFQSIKNVTTQLFQRVTRDPDNHRERTLSRGFVDTPVLAEMTPESDLSLMETKWSVVHSKTVEEVSFSNFVKVNSKEAFKAWILNLDDEKCHPNPRAIHAGRYTRTEMLQYLLAAFPVAPNSPVHTTTQMSSPASDFMFMPKDNKGSVFINKALTYSANVGEKGRAILAKHLRLHTKSKNEHTDTRLVLKNGKFNLLRRYTNVTTPTDDPYHSLLDKKWWKLLVGSFLAFILMNSFYATLYLLPCWFGMETESFLTETPGQKCNAPRAYFFAVQTMSTIGYGKWAPETFWVNGMVMLQSWTGITWFAICSAMIYHKVCRATKLKAYICWAKKAVVNNQEPYFRYNHTLPHDPEFTDEWNKKSTFTLEAGEWARGEPCLCIRFANRLKRQQILPQIHLYFYEERAVLADGGVDYLLTEMDFYLNTARQQGRTRGINHPAPIIALPGMIIHHIDENSPMFGLHEEDLRERRAEVIVVLESIDEACSDSVCARQSYNVDDIMWGYRYKAMVARDPVNQMVVVEYSRISAIERSDENLCASPAVATCVPVMPPLPPTTTKLAQDQQAITVDDDDTTEGSDHRDQPLN